MDSFLGYLTSGVGGNLPVVLELAGVPANPDANPTFRVYGQSALITSGNGTATPLESGNITGATNANPIVITSVAHGLTSGSVVRIASVGGNTAANGLWIVTVLTADTFSIAVAGNGGYISGGTWKTAGLYLIPITGSMVDSLEEGSTYTVLVSWAESAVAKVAGFTFGVV